MSSWSNHDLMATGQSGVSGPAAWVMYSATALFSMMVAGGLIWLLLIEAGNTERRPSFWVARIAGLSMLTLLFLMVALFLLIGGPILPPLCRYDGWPARRCAMRHAGASTGCSGATVPHHCAHAPMLHLLSRGLPERMQDNGPGCRAGPD